MGLFVGWTRDVQIALLPLLLLLVTPVAVAHSSVSPAAPIPSFPPHLVGNVSAVYDLIDRVFAGAQPLQPLNGHGDANANLDAREQVHLTPVSNHFALSLVPACPGVAQGVNCFTLADERNTTASWHGGDGDGDTSLADGEVRTSINATTTAELAAGVGYYLRELCGMTVGWQRGGGSFVYLPTAWPTISDALQRGHAPSNVDEWHVNANKLRNDDNDNDDIGPSPSTATATSLTVARSVPYSHVTQVWYFWFCIGLLICDTYCTCSPLPIPWFLSMLHTRSFVRH